MTSTTSTAPLSAGSAFVRPTSLRDEANGLGTIGRTLHDLRGIRFEDGPGGNQPAPAPAAPAPAAPAPAPAPAQPAPAAPAPAPATPPAATPPAPAPAPAAPANDVPINPKTGQPYTPAETQAYISELRGEAKTNREAKEAADAQLAAVMAALGKKPDGTPLDPSATPEDVAKLAEANKNTALENVVLRHAPALGVNADRLLDSASFLNQLRSKESTDTEGIKTLITEALQKDTSLALVAAAASSGGAQHTGTTPTTARKSMAEAVKAGLTPKG